MKKEKSRLMQKYGNLKNELNVGEIDWGEDRGREVLPSYDSKLLSRFDNYDSQNYLNDSKRAFDKGEPKGRELW
ncbi:hypothetical protein [Lentilactobacillus senioris]|uniref:hypothetical protein n=1 Tax=Lentilactobacillus senioris TaxID=931534 RepID=UPI003D26708E